MKKVREEDCYQQELKVVKLAICKQIYSSALKVSSKELTKRKIGCILYRNIIKGYEEKSK